MTTPTPAASAPAATTRSNDLHVLLAWILTALCVVGIIILAALRLPIPGPLEVIAGVTGGTAGGLSLPSRGVVA